MSSPDSTLNFVFLAGPTAVGKTELAVQAAERAGAEIVNADAFQLYEGLDILTAKPSSDQLARVPHHLVGVVPLSQALSAPLYAEMAERTIREICSRNVPVLVTGGGGFYLKALTHGLDDLPPADPQLQAEILALTAEQRLEELLKAEPHAGDFIDLQNPRRVQRTLELLRQTGLPLHQLRKQQQRPQRAGIHGIVLTRERDDLYARINERTRQMFREGVVEEVRQIVHDPTKSLGETASRAIGLTEILEIIEGRLTEEDAIERIRIATRRYAKRQQTWFRHQITAETIDITTSHTQALTRISELLAG